MSFASRSFAFAVLTLYLLILSGLITIVYVAYSGSGSSAARSAGKGLFAAVLAVQVFLVAFIGPAFTAGAISGERERRTRRADEALQRLDLL